MVVEYPLLPCCGPSFVLSRSGLGPLIQFGGHNGFGFPFQYPLSPVAGQRRDFIQWSAVGHSFEEIKMTKHSLFKIIRPARWDGRVQFNIRDGGYRVSILVSLTAIEIEWWLGPVLDRTLKATWFGIKRWKR